MTKGKKKNVKKTKEDSLKLTSSPNISDSLSREDLVKLAKELKIKNYSRLSNLY